MKQPRRPFLWLTAALALLVSALVFAQAPAKHVVVISIDGLPMDYILNRDEYGLEIPHLAGMLERGSYSYGTVGTFPSVTFPSHVTIVTGARPARHGIRSNVLFAPGAPEQPYWEAKDIHVRTLWDAAGAKGLKTAAVFWPVTGGAKIDYLIPQYGNSGDSYEKQRGALARVSTPGLIDAVENTYHRLVFPGQLSDEDRTTALCYVVLKEKPSLALLHLSALDHEQHRYGRNSQEAYRKLGQLDRLVGQVVQCTKDSGTYDRTAFFIVSDHGFLNVHKQFNPNVALLQAGFIVADVEGKIVRWNAYAQAFGGAASIVLRSKGDEGSAAKVKLLFARLAADPANGIALVFDEAEIGQRGGDTRAAVMLSAAEGFMFGEDAGPSRPLVTDTTRTGIRGVHGHDPRMSSLKATFIASGYGIRSGEVLSEIEMVQIAPTIARYLNVGLANAEGKPIEGILE